MAEATDEADAFLEGLGLNTEPMDASESMYSDLASTTKIASLRYWLRGEISRQIYLAEHNVHLTKPTMADGKAVTKQLSRMEYCRLLIKYYLQMYHLPYFRDDIPGREPADYNKVIDLIVAHVDVRDVIDNYSG